MKTKINKKEQILSLLDQQGIMSTTAIAEGTKANIHITKERLNKLAEEGLIEIIQTPKYVYWKLR